MSLHAGVAPKVIVSWLQEFGYTHAASAYDNLTAAVRERGYSRVRRELEQHATRLAVRDYARQQRSCRT